MRKPFRWFLLGAGVLAGCGPSVAEYCAAGSPECSPADASVGDAAPNDRIDAEVGDSALDGGLEASVGDAAPDDRNDAEVGDSALDGGLEAEVAPSACDPTKSPHDEPCVVDTAFGIFASPAGSDTDPGSKAAPVRTIGRAMDMAKAAGKRVYVCTGSYPEQLVVGSSRDGVNVYGALDCATWSYGANKVRVAPALSGYALEIQSLQMGATFEDLEFDAQNAPYGAAGASSVAVFVSSCQRVQFDRVVSRRLRSESGHDRTHREGRLEPPERTGHDRVNRAIRSRSPATATRPVAPRPSWIVRIPHGSAPYAHPHSVVHDLPFCWQLSRAGARFARAPLGRAFETAQPPSGGSPFCFHGLPGSRGLPLRECRASLSRSSGGPALSETSARSRERLSHKGQES